MQLILGSLALLVVVGLASRRDAALQQWIVVAVATVIAIIQFTAPRFL